MKTKALVLATLLSLSPSLTFAQLGHGTGPSNNINSVNQNATTGVTPCTSEKDATPANVMTCPFGNPAKTTLVMDWMRDVKIQKSADMLTLINLLNGDLGDDRTPDFVADLIDNTDLDDQMKAYLVNTFAKTGRIQQSELAKILLTPDSNSNATLYQQAFLNYRSTDLSDPTLNHAVSVIISDFVGNYSTIYMATPYIYVNGFAGDTYLVAIKYLSQGVKGGAPRAIHQLNEALNAFESNPNTRCAVDAEPGQDSWFPWYIDGLAKTVVALGDIRETNARDAISQLLNSKCTPLVDAAKKAIDELNIADLLVKIRKSDKTSIVSGENFVRNHDGAYEADELDILDALASVVRTNPQIKVFATDECKSGYHESDAAVNDKLKAIAGIQ